MITLYEALKYYTILFIIVAIVILLTYIGSIPNEDPKPATKEDKYYDCLNYDIWNENKKRTLVEKLIPRPIKYISKHVSNIRKPIMRFVRDSNLILQIPAGLIAVPAYISSVWVGNVAGFNMNFGDLSTFLDIETDKEKTERRAKFEKILKPETNFDTIKKINDI